MASKFMASARKKMEEKGTVGALRKEMGAKKGEKIPAKKLDSEAAALHKKAAGDKKLSKEDLKKARRISFAKNANKK